ncbi:MAG: hypothetical protein HY242_01865 [Afipia sp.]|nr:hypothetical protein [Afipia sp.]
MIAQWINEYPVITSKLENYGWFVAPFIVGEEFTELKALVGYIDANPPNGDADRKAIEGKIFERLCDVAFSNQVRARYVWLGLQTPHFKEYSHLYESAIFSYYKREYPAAIALLLMALEGVVLSIAGWRLGSPNRKPSFADLKAAIANIPTNRFPSVPEFDAVQDMYREAFKNFINKSIYCDTNAADFSLSVLNRHVVLHGMDPGNFYRVEDVHRLLLAFDLLIDLLSMSNGIYYPTVPNTATAYNERNDYYKNLRVGHISVRQAAEQEFKFLSEHPNYMQPSNEPVVLYGL